MIFIYVIGGLPFAAALLRVVYYPQSWLICGYKPTNRSLPFVLDYYHSCNNQYFNSYLNSLARCYIENRFKFEIKSIKFRLLNDSQIVK